MKAYLQNIYFHKVADISRELQIPRAETLNESPGGNKQSFLTILQPWSTWRVTANIPPPIFPQLSYCLEDPKENIQI